MTTTHTETGTAVKPVYVASPIKKRRRRTKAQIAQLDQQIVDAITEDHPQSVRHLFYRMTDPRLPEPVAKTESGYNAVQRRVGILRDNGRIPYAWITDASRHGYFVDTFRGKADFIRKMKSLYRADLWRDVGVRIEIWVESRSIASVILDDCQELAVSLYPAGGFTSKTLAFDAAASLNKMDLDGIPVRVIYIGDFDPAGVMIDVDVERKIRKHLDPDIDLSFERVGINPDQIEQFGLPTKLRKKTDRRSLHVKETVEAEAMPAALMRGLLRHHIERHLPPRALLVAKAEEESTRRYFDSLADILEGNDDA